MTTQAEIRSWLNFPNYKALGPDNQPTHMIVACDTFDWEDYPVWVYAEDDVNEKMNLGSMQKIMEVYSYALSLEDQLKQHRVFNIS